MTTLTLRRVCCALLTALILFCSISSLANRMPQSAFAAHNSNLLPMVIPPAPKINARNYVLMDVNSGRILASEKMNEKEPPASLTKLMVLYIVSEELAQGRIKLTDKAHISIKAWKQPGSRMFIREGSNVPVGKLIQGVIVASGNDATVALAEYIAGSTQNFVTMMNATAKRLGMKDTHFADVDGLPVKDHYATAYDLAILARHVIKDFPQYYHWYKQKSITYDNIHQNNRNRLLWRTSLHVDGLKTGHTKAAGYCLISSAKQQGMRLLSVVLGTPSNKARINDSQALLVWGFRFYTTHKLFSAGEVISSPRAWFADHEDVKAGVLRDFYVTIPRGSYSQLKASVKTKTDIEAPIKKGQRLGTIIVRLKNKVIAKAPLLALQSDPSGGWWRRLTDHIALMFDDWFSSDNKQTAAPITEAKP